MKTKLFIMTSMLLIVLASCSSSNDEPAVFQTPDSSVETRLTGIEYPYYYFKGEKIGLELSETKSYVLFREADKEALLNKLSEKEVTVHKEELSSFYQEPAMRIKGEAYDKYTDCLWVEMDLNYKELNELPEVIYASPFVRASESGRWFPMTNKCYVWFYGGIDALSNILSEYKVEILGELDSFENVYVILCTKESKGNALEVANALYENGSVAVAEADFLSGTFD